MRLIFKCIFLGVILFIFFLIPLRTLADGGISISTANNISTPLEQKTNTQEIISTQRLTSNTPKLAEIVAFHITIIALFMPLSVDMVGRISERFGSGVISSYYRREKIPWIVFILSILNIFISVLLIFFSDSTNVLNYVSLGLFVITLFLIIPFLLSLYRYLTDIDWMIGRLTKDVKNCIK